MNDFNCEFNFTKGGKNKSKVQISDLYFNILKQSNPRSVKVMIQIFKNSLRI